MFEAIEPFIIRNLAVIACAGGAAIVALVLWCAELHRRIDVLRKALEAAATHLDAHWTREQQERERKAAAAVERWT